MKNCVTVVSVITLLVLSFTITHVKADIYLNGVLVCSEPTAGAPEIVEDGSGGAILFWHDGRHAGEDAIYAQKVDANCIGQWAEDGVLIYRTDIALGFNVVADGSGGAVVMIIDASTGDFRYYAQRISSGGALPWGEDGTLLGSSPDMTYPYICSDGLGGLVFAWQLLVGEADSLHV